MPPAVFPFSSYPPAKNLLPHRCKLFKPFKLFRPFEFFTTVKVLVGNACRALPVSRRQPLVVEME
jgi:hypothetical protein